MRVTQLLDGLNDCSDGDLVLLYQRRRGDGVVTRLDLDHGFEEERKGNLVPCHTLASDFEKLCQVEVTVGNVFLEVVLVAT